MSEGTVVFRCRTCGTVVYVPPGQQRPDMLCDDCLPADDGRERHPFAELYVEAARDLVVLAAIASGGGDARETIRQIGAITRARNAFEDRLRGNRSPQSKVAWADARRLVAGLCRLVADAVEKVDQEGGE